MNKIDQIMGLLAEAKRAADEAGEPTLAFHIGTALLLAQEIAMGQKSSPRPRR